MTMQKFRQVDASKKSETESLESCQKVITKVVEQVSPKNYQCISIDGYTVIPVTFHPDAEITFKIPRKDPDYGFDKFPKEYHEEIQKLQKELKLTKKQVT